MSTRRSFGVDVDVDLFGFRQHGHRRGRRVDAAAGFGRRHALHAMHAALVFQPAVDPLPFDERDHFLDAADAGVAACSALRAASPGAPRIVSTSGTDPTAKSAASSPPVPARISRTTFLSSFGILGDEKHFELGEQVSRGPRAPRAPPARARACRRRLDAAPPSPRFQRRPSCTRGNCSTSGCISASSLERVTELDRVGLHGGIGHLGHQLVVTRFCGGQLVQHVNLVGGPSIRCYPPETGGRNATSSPGASGVVRRAYSALTATRSTGSKSASVA